MTIHISRTKVHEFPNSKQCNVTTPNGRYTCTNEDLFATLKANEDKDIDVEVDGTLIIAVTAADTAEPEQPFPESTPEPVPTPAPEPKPKKEEKEPAAPKQTKSNPPAAAPTEAPDEETDIPYIDSPVEQSTEGLTENDKLTVNARFPLLKASEIEIRVGQIFAWGVTLLLYKDARCDQERLDALYGPMGWQKSYESIDGRLYCAVSVKNAETGEWISKSDVGTESNTEAEKGQASDAFKRACVCWGSGRELYTAPNITIRAQDTVIEENNKGKLVCKDTFTVKHIAYDNERNICGLDIYSSAKKKVVFSFRK